MLYLKGTVKLVFYSMGKPIFINWKKADEKSAFFPSKSRDALQTLVSYVEKWYNYKWVVIPLYFSSLRTCNCLSESSLCRYASKTPKINLTA